LHNGRHAESGDERTVASLPDELARCLSTVRTPGDFYAAGTSTIALPRLEVNGVGRLALPLLPAQAEQLVAIAERAPFGRGEDTLIDTAVRRTWQIGAGEIRIEGRQWTHALADIVARAAAGLGVSDPVVPELYKLLVYDEGSFFVSHRDTEKAPGMFATLIIALPSLHAGGELLVRHNGREVRLDLRCEDPSDAAFAAFYADCVHEVLPVTSGCRLALVYNLLRTGRGRLPRPPSYENEQAGIEKLLRRWSAGKAQPQDETPEKLVFLLEHAYTPAELSFAALKGADAAAGAVLAAAAPPAGCDLHAALLSIEESGSAEHTGYSRSRHWEDDDEAQYEIGEVFDSSRTLSHWARPDGSVAGFGAFPFNEAELSPADALADMEPDEQHFYEATGNEGASFERTYRRAALVLWPQQRRLAVFNQAGLRVTLPYLDDLAQRWAASGEGCESPLWLQAHELSGHMLGTWPKPIHQPGRTEPSDEAKLLTLLARLQEPERIEAVAAKVVAAGGHGKVDNPPLIQALSLLPASRRGELLERVVAANATISVGSCGDLLARAAASKAFAGSLVAAGTALVDALPGAPGKARGEFAWLAQRVDVDLVVDLASALPRIDAALADRAVSHLLAWPKTYALDALILPAVRRLQESRTSGEPAAVQRLRAACLEHLRARAALPLEPPRGWARAQATSCKCPRCSALNMFLGSADQKTWIFKAGEADRAHVQETIDRDRCDLDCSTDKRGRPYSLVCTKNQASYDRRVAQRQEDLEDLATLA